MIYLINFEFDASNTFQTGSLVTVNGVMKYLNTR